MAGDRKNRARKGRWFQKSSTKRIVREVAESV